MWKRVAVILALSNAVVCHFDLLILHNNDIHGRFEETERNSGTCQPGHKNVSCVGGFARTVHVVRKYRNEAENGAGPNVIFLNAGDTFIGTVWYTIHTWNISSAFMNLLRPDVQCLGNHEFDKGTDELYRYISALNYPTIGGNVDFSKVPNLTDKIPKSVVLNVNGTKVGVIGHVTTETQKISSPGNTIFMDEVESVREESERLDALGVKIIVVLGHSGYVKDQEIAKKVPLVDVVVGGHTNTFLWNGEKPDTEEIEGPYPTIVTQDSGKKVPVVQAYAYTKYLGILKLKFDADGNVLNTSGQPTLLNNSIPQDQDVLDLLETYRTDINEVNKETVGRSLVTLDGTSAACRNLECNYGNLIADANVLYKASVTSAAWTDAPIGLMNGGSIRASVLPSLSDGSLTRGDLLATLPFGNQVVSLKLRGSDLVETLELGIRSDGETSLGEFLQVSGLQVVYDRSKPSMSRVVSVRVRCGDCEIPSYKPIDVNKNYTIVTTDFLADGFDGHYVLKERSFDRKYVDLSDIDILSWYFKKYNPVFAEVHGRLTFINSHDVNSKSALIEPCQCLLLVFIKLLVVVFNMKMILWD
ncbi:unnamed protein product [Phyllotreta striolata]|uniref:5'-nucleotidase n=1 Tax=Phyllotreta striolata TaxID=444603 RepID=A0A9N9TN09_PHYSR|nr:unnamed protein product [Phyllotreta striolata]